MKLLLPILLAGSAFAQSWMPQNSGVTASLRGVSVVNSQVVWASGTGGTWLRTSDGGATWQSGAVEGATDLDFRGVRPIDEESAYLLSSGTGAKSRVYKIGSYGLHWRLLFTNPDPKGFFDGIAFWDAQHGIVVGDPVDGQITVFTTDDGGENWTRQRTVPSPPGEGAFAASNSILVVHGDSEAWIATGEPGGARVLHSIDRGRTWSVATTPVRNDGPGAGIFSLAFADSLHGLAVGGDYTKDKETRGNIALTADGGKTWTAPDHGPGGYRSAVLYLADRDAWLAVGTSGSDISHDGGQTWTSFDAAPYNALSGASSDAVWAVGPRGRIAKLSGLAPAAR
jgi:photosystem II stability/assembly factor-like uncharacterized protein